MIKNKHYTGSYKMSKLISEHYSTLLVLFRFDIPLGVGEKTIEEVCKEAQVDLFTFLYVVHFILYREVKENEEDLARLNISDLIRYLKNSHGYFLDYRLVEIRHNLFRMIEGGDPGVTYAIQHFYDEYTEEVRLHMMYENDIVFPYAEWLLNTGQLDPSFSISVFEKKHDKIELKIQELKNIIIKYYPRRSDYQLNSVLHDFFCCQQELCDHNDVEDYIFVPAVACLENTLAKKESK